MAQQFKRLQAIYGFSPSWTAIARADEINAELRKAKDRSRVDRQITFVNPAALAEQFVPGHLCPEANSKRGNQYLIGVDLGGTKDSSSGVFTMSAEMRPAAPR